jgi:hydroxypyruvate reductase
MNLREDAREIFLAGVRRVDPKALLGKALELEGDKLKVSHAAGRFEYDLSLYEHVVVVGMGKASAVLAEGLQAILGSRIRFGFVVTKSLGDSTCDRIELAEAGHPVPDERSVEAGKKVLEIAERVRALESKGEHCLVLVLVSGGGSALLAAPAEGISLEEKAATTRLLLASGATIQEMNAVRKHLSAIKGGRLAQAFHPADILSLILSDVVGDDLDAIASGPTVPDPTTWESTAAILKAREVWHLAPPKVQALFLAGIEGRCPDTPKPGLGIFSTTQTVLVGNNMLALRAAEAEAKSRGYQTLLLGSRIVGEAREIAKIFPALAADIADYGTPLSRPACVLAGGETTVTLRGKGKGGRNQEMALAALCSIESGKDLCFLSAGTDGNDGPTDAAGAFACPEIKEKAARLGLDARAYLADNDSYGFFNAVDGLLKTGSTGTNVCDLQILLLA